MYASGSVECSLSILALKDSVVEVDAFNGAATAAQASGSVSVEQCATATVVAVPLSGKVCPGFSCVDSIQEISGPESNESGRGNFSGGRNSKPGSEQSSSSSSSSVDRSFYFSSGSSLRIGLSPYSVT